MTTDDLLNLEGVAQRASTFRLDVVDANLNRTGQIDMSRSRPPAVENNINARIKRAMRGLILPPGTAPNLNPLVDRLRPVFVLENGYTRGMGVFCFLDETDREFSYGNEDALTLGDQLTVLDDPIAKTMGLPAGTSISATLASMFEEAGIAPGNYEIDPIATLIGGKGVVWPVGKSRLTIMNELCGMAGCYSVFFDYRGIGRVMVRQDLETTTPSVRYKTGNDLGNILRGSVVNTNQILQAFNRYLAMDTSALNNPIAGYYDIPDAAPNSFANTRRRRTKTITAQGLADVLAAQSLAQATYQQDATDYSWCSFQGMIDPRPDTFDVVEFLGERWREQKWSMTLAPGARMQHDLRKVVETAVAV